MEMKSIIFSKELLVEKILDKKHWLALTSLILVILIGVIPPLAEMDVHDEHIISGILVVMAITMINCLIDFNYLHDSKKFAYYMSKPVNDVQRLHLTLISNVVFATFFMAILSFVGYIYGCDILMIMRAGISCLMVLIFLSAAGSYLCGNTIFAGLATGFIFLLPVFLYGIIQFAVSLVSSIVDPYNSQLIMDYIMNKYYNMGIIYFIDYGEGFNILSLLYLVVLLVAIYVFNRFLIDKRLNERIGQFIVFKSFERFVAMMFSLVVPFLFILAFGRNDLGPKLIAFVILGSLTYYVASIILEKSFKLSRQTYKILGLGMGSFLALVFVIGFGLSTVDDEVPNLEDIKSVVITENSHFWSFGHEASVLYIEADDYETYGVQSYSSTDAIEAILDIHRWIIEGDNSVIYSDVNIIYEYKDGSYDRNYYRLVGDDAPGDNSLYLKGNKALRQSLEYKVSRMPFIYDPTYASQFEVGIANLQQGEEVITINLDHKDILGLHKVIQMDKEASFEVDGGMPYPIWDDYFLYSSNHYYYNNKDDIGGVKLYSDQGNEEAIDVYLNDHHTVAYLLGLVND